MTLLIGLTGERGVGKSEIAKFVTKNFYFGTSHAFAVGKRLTLYYYMNEMRIPEVIAYEMVFGKLKDTPSKYLPNNSTSRLFMEELGFCMGSKLGSEWTLGPELERLKRSNKPGYIIESIVYEAGYFVEQGGIIIRVEREDRNESIQAVHTSSAQKDAPYHILLKNNGDLDCLETDVVFLINSLLAWQAQDTLFTNLSTKHPDKLYIIGD